MKWYPFSLRMSFAMSLLMTLCACPRPHPYPDTPELKFIALSKDTMKQGFLNTDSVIVYFSFTDGDGDIGDEPGDSIPDLMLKDLRTNTIEFFKLPLVKSTTSGPISAEASVRIYNSCCIYDDGTPPCTPMSDTLTQVLIYELFLRDQAGNISEAISLPPIHLICN